MTSRRGSSSVIHAHAVSHVDLGKSRRQNPVPERRVCEAGGHACGCQQHDAAPPAYQQNPVPMAAMRSTRVATSPSVTVPTPQRPARRPDRWYDDEGITDYRDRVIEYVATEARMGRAPAQALLCLDDVAIRDAFIAERTVAEAALGCLGGRN